MALDESALSALLDALRVGEGTDLVRELAQFGLQQLIELEATEAIGAGRYERSDGRVTERNGHRPKVLTTKAGDLKVKIPKLRSGAFFPGLLEPRRRIDQALYAVVMLDEQYVSQFRAMELGCHLIQLDPVSHAADGAVPEQRARVSD